jgi:hypothetical protein
MAVLSSLNQSKKIAGVAQVYLVARPTGGYTGGTDALRVTNLKSQFFTDAATDACRVLIPSIQFDLDASGVEIKLKQNSIEFDPNAGSKYKAMNAPSEATVSWTFKDMDAGKIMDAFSCVAGDQFTTAAATGVAGRKTVMIGRQGSPLEVAILVRYPAGTVSAGGVAEFQNIYIPYATMTPDWDIKLDKKNLAVCKLSATAICDMSLIGSAAMPPVALIDDVTAAGI